MTFYAIIRLSSSPSLSISNNAENNEGNSLYLNRKVWVSFDFYRCMPCLLHVIDRFRYPNQSSLWILSILPFQFPTLDTVDDDRMRQRWLFDQLCECLISQLLKQCDNELKFIWMKNHGTKSLKIRQQRTVVSDRVSGSVWASATFQKQFNDYLS